MSGNKTRQQPLGNNILLKKKKIHNEKEGLWGFVQNLTVRLLPGKSILIICLNNEFFSCYRFLRYSLHGRVRESKKPNIFKVTH